MNKYVSKLELSFDPFASAEKSRTFFSGGERQALLQRLQEQAHFGAPLSMVSGTLGSGKTTLAREFQRSFGDEALCVPVHATLFMNQHQFLDALLEQLPFGASTPEPSAIVDDLVRYAESLYLDARTLVIIVDDAHELASEVLEIIDRLTNKASEGAVHVLLLGELQLVNMLHSSLGNNAIGSRLAGRLLEEELESLGNDEALQYIKQKLADAGYTQEIPLHRSVIGEIVNEANGVPGTINVLVTDALNNKMEAVPEIPRPQSLIALGAPYWATAAGLVIALFLAAFLLPPNESPDAEIALDQSEATRTQISLPVSPLASTAPNTASQAPLDTGSQEPSASAEIMPDSEPGASTTPTASLAAATDDASRKLNMPRISNSESAMPYFEPEYSEPTELGLSDFEVQLLSYNPDDFTLQIMGSRSEDAVQRFVNRELSAFSRGYFETIHEDAPWFVVVSGHFTSRAAADRAMQDLPANVRRLKPWIRSMSDVQSAIEAR